MAIVTRSFTFTGTTQTFRVPPFVTSILIKTWGAGGGTRFTAGGFGGPGGFSIGTLPVANGDNLSIITGQGGSVSTSPTFGGGGGGGTDTFASILGASGGGRSSVLKNGTEVITAAGGGGGSSSTSSPAFSNGGSGGGLTGTDAFVNSSGTADGGGKGGTQSAGGSGGVNPAGAASNGLPGSAFKGGQGGPSLGGNSGGGGGGGGGFFGGGGGIGQFNTAAPGFQDLAGGGGSSFIGGVLLGSTLSTAQNTSTSSTSLNLRPPNQTDANYVAGVGLGASSSAGGNGLVVLIYDQTTLTINKQVDKNITELNTTLTYTILLNNQNVNTLGNIIFIDTVPNGTTFATNSLQINNVANSNNPNPPGFTIDTLNPGINTITFKVNVGNGIPNPNPLSNIASISASGGFVANSNAVTTTIVAPEITLNKSVNKSFASLGDILTYTIVATNLGTVTATNIIFVDTIPNGSSLVPSTFNQDGNLILTSPNPPGVSLSNINPGSTSTISFKVIINTLPNPNPINNISTMNSIGGVIVNSNTVSTLINVSSLSSSKIVNKVFANVGDILTYTIPIANSGNVSANNILFIDTIPNDTSLILGTFKQDGILITGSPNFPGVTISNIAPNAISTIVFSVKVNTIPTPNPILNTASSSYTYTVDPSIPNEKSGNSNTNVVSTKVNNANLANIVKFVNKSFANCSDIITYTIVIPNAGNVTAQNVIFTDTIPNGTSFISNSVFINGIQQTGSNPNSGISIPNISPSSTTTLTFSVKVIC